MLLKWRLHLIETFQLRYNQMIIFSGNLVNADGFNNTSSNSNFSTQLLIIKQFNETIISLNFTINIVFLRIFQIMIYQFIISERIIINIVTDVLEIISILLLQT